MSFPMPYGREVLNVFVDFLEREGVEDGRRDDNGGGTVLPRHPVSQSTTRCSLRRDWAVRVRISHTKVTGRQATTIPRSS